MTVKEAVILAAEELGVGDKVKNYYENGGEEGKRETETLVRCFNIVENEIALDYLPLRRAEKFVSDGCVAYTAFAEPPVEILSVRGETGRSLPFTAGEDGVLVRAGCVTVEYSVRPRPKAAGDFPELSQKGDARLLALGTACEYALMSGNYEAASLLDKRYRDAIACACRERGGRFRLRRWV